MSVRLTLKPGQRGTKQLVEAYGDRLVCVRYRYDAAQGKRYKTVELIEETANWVPPQPEIAPETLVGVRVVWGEIELARQIRQAGGRWNGGQKVWELRYDAVVRLGLAERLVFPESAAAGGGEKHLSVDT